MSAARKILHDALCLSQSERAEVAAALLASLDERDDEGAQETWAREIERRAKRVLTGESKGAPWDEVHTRLLARLSRA